MQKESQYYIESLKLIPHPEGGYYREIFRSAEKIDGLPDRYTGKRCLYTSIYFLLEGEQVSKFHRLKSDELWYFHKGSTALIYLISETGDLQIKNIGDDPRKGEEFQVLIKKDTWFAAEVKEKSSFVLAGCVVAPGFEFSDFELGDKEQLLNKYPGYKELISKFTG